MLQVLDLYMHNHKPYLNPKFNLNQLAEKTQIKPHTISQVLNTALNRNFFDYINQYRVKECTRLLEQQTTLNTANRKTVLEIMYEAGFNSKSAFHRAFKKHVGVTPTQYYRKQVQK
jgi:AraC-like DNA-binding protein